MHVAKATKNNPFLAWHELLVRHIQHVLFFIQINSAAAADDDDDYYYGWMDHVVSWESHKQRSDGVNAPLREFFSTLAEMCHNRSLASICIDLYPPNGIQWSSSSLLLWTTQDEDDDVIRESEGASFCAPIDINRHTHPLTKKTRPLVIAYWSSLLSSSAMKITERVDCGVLFRGDTKNTHPDVE